MKKLFVIALATAALASCSKVEPIEPGHKSAIGFSKSFVENSTKALITTANIANFSVWGTENGASIFNGVEVRKDDDTQGSTWGYTGTRYWHENSAYKFAAIAPFAHGLTNIVLTNQLPTTATYTLVDGGTDSQIDLLYDAAADVNVTTDLPTTAVAFNFEHMLAKVQFSFTNGHIAACGYKVQISELKIAAFSSATVTFASKTWTAPTPTTPLALTFPINDDDPIAENTTVNSRESLIIPAAADTYTITGKAEIIYNSNVVKTINFNQTLPALQAGYHYDIKATITSDKPIVFSATVNDTWGDGADTTLN